MDEETKKEIEALKQRITHIEKYINEILRRLRECEETAAML